MIPQKIYHRGGLLMGLHYQNLFPMGHIEDGIATSFDDLSPFPAIRRDKYTVLPL